MRNVHYHLSMSTALPILKSIVPHRTLPFPSTWKCNVHAFASTLHNLHCTRMHTMLHLQLYPPCDAFMVADERVHMHERLCWIALPLGFQPPILAMDQKDKILVRPVKFCLGGNPVPGSCFPHPHPQLASALRRS